MVRRSLCAGIVGCGDGRIIVPATEYVKAYFGAKFVDYASEPGCDRVIATGTPNQIEALKRQYLVYLKAHGHVAAAVVGHQHCAANPGSQDEHFESIRIGVHTMLGWEISIPVIGLWVAEVNPLQEVWQVQAIYDPRLGKSFQEV
jgi:hypothetical protein